MSSSVSPVEIARFDSMAASWWDLNGPMRALHRMNSLRVGWIAARSASGARLLDVGCGAGIAAEALARRGFNVLGIDAAGAAIRAARAHAPAGLRLDYREGEAAGLAGTRFQVITALEVIEHVPDPAAFMATLAGLLDPDGKLFVSTLNRTAASLIGAKIAAEYVLRWVPPGTHDWRRFITPAELAGHARAAGLRATEFSGMVRSPLSGRWRAGPDMRINYIMAARAG